MNYIVRGQSKVYFEAARSLYNVEKIDKLAALQKVSFNFHVGAIQLLTSTHQHIFSIHRAKKEKVEIYHQTKQKADKNL